MYGKMSFTNRFCKLIRKWQIIINNFKIKRKRTIICRFDPFKKYFNVWLIDTIGNQNKNVNLKNYFAM